jgi:hypothetical protein
MLPTIETPILVANVDSNTLRSQLSELRSRCDELISNSSIFNMVDSISFSVERKDNLGMDVSSYCNYCFGWHVSVRSPISYNSSFPLFKLMEKSILTTSFAYHVVDITIFRPLFTIDTPLPYGCSPLGSFQVGYSDV